MTIQLDQVGFGKPISWHLRRHMDASHPTLEIDLQIGTGILAFARAWGEPAEYAPVIHWAAISMHGEELCVAMMAQLMLAGVPERKD